MLYPSIYIFFIKRILFLCCGSTAGMYDLVYEITAEAKHTVTKTTIYDIPICERASPCSMSSFEYKKM